MDIYRLTPRGEALAHSYRFPNNPAWSVLHFLSKRGYSDASTIYANVPESSPNTLAKLSKNGIISGGKVSTVPME